MENKAHELFKEYYMRRLHYSKTYDREDVEWLKNTLPCEDEDDDFDWAYGFSYDLSCDYGPSYPLYLILYHAGVEKNDIGNICPWKTSIRIREVDNSVQYYTYQHMEDL